MEKQPIQPGKTYWVEVERTRFKVRTIRASALRGWWFCEGEDAGDPLMIPEDKLEPAADE